MASVDVPVALLGYGTVGCRRQPAARRARGRHRARDRATGCASCEALVRDPTKERGFAAGRGVLTTDIADDPRRPVDRGRRRGDGRHRAGRRATCSSCSRAGKLGRHGEQAARRAARRGALRGRVRGGRPAAVRGERVRGDPGDQGAARVARRRRTSTACSGSSTARRTSSSPRWRPARPTRRRSPRRSAAATPRPTRPTTSPAPTRPRRWRSSPPSRSARA